MFTSSPHPSKNPVDFCFEGPGVTGGRDGEDAGALKRQVSILELRDAATVTATLLCVNWDRPEERQHDFWILS